jgi:hypothetical protein
MFDYLDRIPQAFDAAVKKQGDGFLPATKQQLLTTCSL